MRRWEELRPELDARGIRIVALSSDTVERTAAGMHKHGLRAVMLSDPDLAVTDRYNLRNPKNFALKSGVIVPLAIPTTFLVTPPASCAGSTRRATTSSAPTPSACSPPFARRSAERRSGRAESLDERQRLGDQGA